MHVYTPPDLRTRTLVSSYAWDCVVGSGRAEEMLDGVGDEPGADELQGLARVLGHEPTADEQEHFHRCWRQCLQDVAQP